jgi:hypothetical protein
MLATAATKGVTVIVAWPETPSLVARMVVLPTASAETRPADDTVATDGVDELHVTLRPVNTPPEASRTVAFICTVLPATSDAMADVTDTDATGIGVTEMDALPVLPSLVAVTVLVPTAIAVTRPLAETLATDGVLDVQVTERPLSVAPVASLAFAVSCTTCPICMDVVAGVTTTAATAD